MIDRHQKLLCFSERAKYKSGHGKDFKSFTVDLKDSKSPVICLEPFTDSKTGSNKSDFKILTIHADGEIRCYSQDLQVQEWKAKTFPDAQPNDDSRNLLVEFATVTTLEKALQSFLKHREDVVSMFASEAEASTISLLILITRTLGALKGKENVLNFRIIQIKNSTTISQRLQELGSLELPEPVHLGPEKHFYSWDGQDGTLLQNNNNALAIYDLNEPIPILRHHLNTGGNKIASCLHLSPVLVMISTRRSISIINVQFRSVQAEYSLKKSKINNSTAQSEDKKESSESSRLLSYFSSLGLIVMARGRELLAVPITTHKDKSGGSRKRKRDGFLINSIGCGVISSNDEHVGRSPAKFMPKSLQTYLHFSQVDDEWEKRMHSLNKLFAKGLMEEFESMMKIEMDTPALEMNKKYPTKIEESDDIAKKKRLDLRKVHYFLSKVFSIGKDRKLSSKDENSLNADLKITWFSKDICYWLIRLGLFTKENVEMSVKLEGSLPKDSYLSVDAYVRSLVNWDPTLGLLLSLLESPTPLKAEEIIHASRYLIPFKPSQGVKLLTTGSSREDDAALNAQPMDCNVSDDFASTQNEITSRGSSDAVFRSVIRKLSSHAAVTISHALKSVLSIPELRGLVDLLRKELAEGWWLSSYMEDNLQSMSDNVSNSSYLASIAKTLNCVIDSIGTGGWILGDSTAVDLTETADSIAYVKAEISAALEGIEEATYLKGMLGELLLHGKSALVKSHDTFTTDQTANKILTAKIGSTSLENVLPLGLQAAQGVSLKTVLVGGDVMNRSRRDIRRLQSKMVGEYSFDSIMV